MSRYLLKSMEEARSCLKDRDVSLFLDYDGTLTPVAGRPEDARLSFQMKELVRTLAVSMPVAIVSGRGLADIMSLVGIDGVAYAGNHGLEAAAPDFTMTYDIGRAAREELDGLAPALSELEERWKGVIFENKGASHTVHYRLLGSRQFPLFKEGFDKAVAPALSRGRVRLAESKRAFEIKARVNWDKGRAVLWMLGRKRFRGTTPIFIGDDETDKDAYRALGPEGLSVHVGCEADEAAFHLIAQDEVKMFLKLLLDTHEAAR
ncbi:MAG: trehalose-phosphatase [Thermodesulfobacteriota bacterium]|nr:MAG: trehalose-phosphatase [Thermodesulfobacteriota bacterium]